MLYGRLAPSEDGFVTRRRPSRRDDTAGAPDARQPNGAWNPGTHEDDPSGEPVSSAREGSLGERLRTRLGLSPRQWTWLVSLLMFLPYPAFVGLYLAFPIDEGVFLAATVAFSVLIAVLGLYL